MVGKLNSRGGILCHDNKPVISFVGDKLELTDKGAQVARRASFSASAMKAQHGCRARFAVEKLLPFDSRPLTPAGLGNGAHKAFEELMKLPKTKRTQKAAKDALETEADRLIAKGELSAEDRGQWIKTTTGLTLPLFKIRNVKEIDVAYTEYKAVTTIGNAPFIGAVDLIENVDGGICVGDYKTSNKVPDLSYGDEHGDQVRLYAHVLPNLLNKEVVDGQLYYTAPGITDDDRLRHVDLSQGLITKVVDDFQAMYQVHVQDMKDKVVPTKAGGLCAWCPAVNFCPVAQRNGTRPADKYDGALSVEDAFGSTLSLTATNTTPQVDAQPHSGSGFDDFFNIENSAPTELSGLVNEALGTEPTAPAFVPTPVEETPESHEVVYESEQDNTASQGEGENWQEYFEHAFGETTDHVEAAHEQAPNAGYDTGFGEENTGYYSAYDSGYDTDREQYSQGNDGYYAEQSTHSLSEQVPQTNESVQAMNPLYTDDKQWVTTTHAINGSTGEAAAAFGYIDLAVNAYLEAGQDPHQQGMFDLAQTFAYIVGQVQSRIADTTSPNTGINIRLRAALRTALDVSKPPVGGTREQWENWISFMCQSVLAYAQGAAYIIKNPLTPAVLNQFN